MIVLIVALVGALWAVWGSGAVADEPTTAESAAGDESSPRVVDAEDLRDQVAVFLEAQRIEVTPVDDSRVPAISRDVARQINAEEFAIGGPGATVQAVELVEITTPAMGRELEPEGSKASRVEPLYVDRLVWLVIQDGVQQVEYGPMMGRQTDSPPVTHDSTLVSFIDAGSGEGLFALAF